MKSPACLTLFIIGALGSLGGCKVAVSPAAPSVGSTSTRERLTAKLDEKKAIQLANAYAEANKMDLARYRASQPTMEVIGGKKKWEILYFPQGEVNVVGDHFSFIIDDETQKVGILAGM